MFHSTHSSKNNTETQPKEKCQLVRSQFKPSCGLNKHKRSLSLHVLKDIIQKKLKRKKIRHAYNTMTMKQEVFLEDLEHVGDAMRFKSLGHLKKHIRNISQREIVASSGLRRQKKRSSLHVLQGVIRKKK